jgi:predicted transcriptional regulator
MGDRFYQQMREKTGWAPGLPEHLKNNRRRRMAWTDESKAQAVEMYTEAEPTPETSMEIVKDIAEELGESPNGVRMILTKAGVYVKKAPATGTAKASGGGGTRVSKADAAQALKDALSDAGQDVDDDIIDKLTGKASVYFTGVINAINN